MMLRSLLLSCLVVAAAAISCAADYPQVDAAIDPSNATIGQPLRLTVSVVCPDLSRLNIDEPFTNDNKSTWTLLDKKTPPDEKINATEWRRKIEYSVATFETGQIAAPALTVKYQPANGSEVQKLAQAAPVTITSLLPPTDAGTKITSVAPKDIKPPVALPFPRWIVFVAIAAIVAIVGALIFVFWGRMRSRIQAVVHPPKRLDHWALDSLDALEKERLVEQRRVVEYYVRLAETMRVYLGRLLNLNTLDWTTYELLEHLRETSLPEAARERIAEVLGEADLVKFAKYNPEAPLCRHSLEKGRDVVRQSSYLLQPATVEKSQEAKSGDENQTETIQADAA